MIGNPKYGDYVPDRITPNMLTRDYLLSVSILLLIFIVDCIFGSNPLSTIANNRKESNVPIKLFKMEWLSSKD